MTSNWSHLLEDLGKPLNFDAKGLGLQGGNPACDTAAGIHDDGDLGVCSLGFKAQGCC